MYYGAGKSTTALDISEDSSGACLNTANYALIFLSRKIMEFNQCVK
jgi:hypothetical protein